jgi:hypothetical protein
VASRFSIGVAMSSAIMEAIAIATNIAQGVDQRMALAAETSPGSKGEAHRDKQISSRHFGRSSGLSTDSLQMLPQPCQQGGEQENDDGVDRLKPTGRDDKVAQRPSDVVVGKQAKRAADLLVANPEGNGKQDNG